MNRGRRREEIYIDKGDYIAFIELLQEASEVFNVCIAAYCLMSNHLLIQTPDGNLSRCMRHINGVYTQRFNRRHGHDGAKSGEERDVHKILINIHLARFF